MTDEQREGTRVPVRLKGGRRAYLELPWPIDQEDADEIKKWVDAQVEGNEPQRQPE